MPNICEESLIVNPPVEIEIESENDTDGCKEKALREILSCSDLRSDKKLEVFGMNRKRCSLIVLDRIGMFGSSPFLNRPPIPSAPKPTSRRDLILRRCVSTEGLSPKKRKSEQEATIKGHKRSLSDCEFLEQLHLDKTKSTNLNLNVIKLEAKAPQNKDNDIKSVISCSSVCSMNRKDLEVPVFSLSVQNIPSLIAKNEDIWKKTLSTNVSLIFFINYWLPE